VSPVPLEDFRQVWLVDFAAHAPPGERPGSICLEARELRSGRALQLRGDDLRGCGGPPYPVGPEALFVAYDAAAGLGCHLALGWPMPARILDLHAEYRRATAGLVSPCGHGLAGALAAHGLGATAIGGREAVRVLLQGDGPPTAAQEVALLGSCRAGAEALSRLLPAMLPGLDLPRALLRGRYMAAVARMERAGVPIDVDILARLRRHWRGIRGRLVADVDRRFGVYDGPSFRAGRWAAWLAARGIAWPRLESGALDLEGGTFRELARAHPDVALMHELRVTLAKLRPEDLAVGADGRSRCPLAPFASKTSRNQPGTAGFIFGPATWLRGLIRPGPGRAVAYVDWAQQEFGIAAALSGDPGMRAAYASGDPYLALGKWAGQIPPDGTGETHPMERERFKACTLGVQYAMTEQGLARRLDCPLALARTLLQIHHAAYPQFWRWSDASVNHALLTGQISTVFGWTMQVGPDANVRSLRNYPMQANGAEMLRLACCLATERGVEVCAPVHDALLIGGGPKRLRGRSPRRSGPCARRRRSSWTASPCGPTSRSSPGPRGTWTSVAGRCGTRSSASSPRRNRSLAVEVAAAPRPFDRRVIDARPPATAWRRRRGAPPARAPPRETY